jgi:hypothetical protein
MRRDKGHWRRKGSFLGHADLSNKRGGIMNSPLDKHSDLERKASPGPRPGVVLFDFVRLEKQL